MVMGTRGLMLWPPERAGSAQIVISLFLLLGVMCPTRGAGAADASDDAVSQKRDSVERLRAYRCSLRDNHGLIVAAGTLCLPREEDITIFGSQGTWRITPYVSPPAIMEQVDREYGTGQSKLYRFGGGDLRATYYYDVFLINLHPEKRDCNLQLRGVPVNGVYYGKWYSILNWDEKFKTSYSPSREFLGTFVAVPEETCCPQPTRGFDGKVGTRPTVTSGCRGVCRRLPGRVRGCSPLGCSMQRRCSGPLLMRGYRSCPSTHRLEAEAWQKAIKLIDKLPEFGARIY
jgi:hypothetical protein